MNTNSVGLIGVGLLGSALGNRLIDSGSRIYGFDSNEKQLDSLKQSGGIACDSPTEVVQNCNVLILSLPSSDVVLSLVQQLRSDFEPSQIVIDTTTGDPQQMVAISQSLAERHALYHWTQA